MNDDESRYDARRQDDAEPPRDTAPTHVGPPSNSRREAAESDSAIVEMYGYSGPLPHPELLERYKQVDPNAARIIIEQFREQGEHRRAQQRRKLTHDIIQGYAGIGAGTIILLAIVVLAWHAIDRNYQIAGTITALGGLAALTAVFVLRRPPTKD